MTLILTGIACAAAAACGRALGACAVSIGVCWAFLNGFFLFQLIGIALNQKHGQQNKIFMLSVLKFPVLYVAGFYILKSRFFPAAGILAGMGVFFASVLLGWIGLHFSVKKLAGNTL